MLFEFIIALSRCVCVCVCMFWFVSALCVYIHWHNCVCCASACTMTACMNVLLLNQSLKSMAFSLFLSLLLRQQMNRPISTFHLPPSTTRSQWHIIIYIKNIYYITVCIRRSTF